MKIIIEGEDDIRKVDLELADDGLDNPNYVDLIIGGTSGTFPIDELKAAILAFDLKREAGT